MKTESRLTSKMIEFPQILCDNDIIEKIENVT
jgi:hypothetical protein